MRRRGDERSTWERGEAEEPDQAARDEDQAAPARGDWTARLAPADDTMAMDLRDNFCV